MHLKSLKLSPFGHFENRSLSFGEPNKLCLIYGANEAGKSTLLRALETFWFGFDHKSRFQDDHYFSDNSLRLYATLAAGGSEFELERSKQKKLVDLNKAGGEGFMPDPKHRATFAQMFALDGERLRYEAEAVLGQASNSGTLATALLGQALEKRWRALDQEAEAYFKPRATTKKIMVLRKKITDLDVQISDRQIDYEAWQGLQQEIKGQELRRRQLEQSLGDLGKQQDNLAQAQKFHQLKLELESLETELSSLAHIPLLTMAAIQTFEKKRAAVQDLKASLRHSKEQLETLETKRADLLLNAPLWEARNQVTSAELKSQKLKSLEDLIPQSDPKADFERSALAGNLGAIFQDIEAWSALLVKRQMLEGTVDPGKFDLPASFVGHTAQGLLKQIQAGQFSSEHLQTWRAKFAQLDEHQREATARLKLAAEAESRASLQLNQLQDQGGGVAIGGLLDARRIRDKIWQDLKRDLGNLTLQADFEQSLARVDQVSEDFAASQKNSGAWDNANREKSDAQVQKNVVEKSLELGAQERESELLAVANSLGFEVQDIYAVLNDLAELFAGLPRLRQYCQQSEAFARHQVQLQELANVANSFGFKGQSSQLLAWLDGKANDLQRLKQLEALAAGRTQHLGLVDQARAELGAALHSLGPLIDKDLSEQQALANLVLQLDHETKQREGRARLSQEIDATFQRQSLSKTRLADFEKEIQAQFESDAEIEALSVSQLSQKSRLCDTQAKLKADLNLLLATGLEVRFLEMPSQALDEAGDEYKATKIDLVAQREELLQEQATVKERLRDMEASTGARDLRFERASLKDELKLAVSSYLNLSLQARLLRHGLDDFLATQEDALLGSASQLFHQLTQERYVRVERETFATGEMQMLAVPKQGPAKSLDALSDGTKDQLLMALRIAALDCFALDAISPDAGPLPLICDDLLIHFDDERAGVALQLLADRASRQQVLYFTHHQHLVDLAQQNLPANQLSILRL